MRPTTRPDEILYFYPHEVQSGWIQALNLKSVETPMVTLKMLCESPLRGHVASGWYEFCLRVGGFQCASSSILFNENL